MVLRLGDVRISVLVLVLLLLVLVDDRRRKRSSETPIWQYPSLWHSLGANVHFRIPSGSKILSCLETSAGVSGGLDVVKGDCGVGADVG